MIVLRHPSHYSYLDPGLVHTEFGFTQAAYQVADDATIHAGMVFQEESLADVAVRALEIFLAAGVEYRAVNVALAVYQAISERLPYDEFTWAVEGLEDIIASWPMPTPVERAKSVPEQRELFPEKPRRMPPEEDSPELPPVVPERRLPVPVEVEVPPVEVEVPPVEVEVPPVELEVPLIPRPPVEIPGEPRRRPLLPVPGVPVEVEVPPVEVGVPPVEVPPVVPPVEAVEEAEAVGVALDYGKLREIGYGVVDRLLSGLRAGDVKVDLVTEVIEDLTGEDMLAQYLRQGDLLLRAVAKYMQDHAEIPAGDTEPPTRKL